jgi:hypothetical protein
MHTEPPGASSSGLPSLPRYSRADPSVWIREFRSHFEQWVFGPIDRLVPSDDALVGFIMMACAIDYLASLWWGESTEGSVKKAYTGFICAFFPPGKYDPEGLYDSLRNGLVHLFTIKDKKYALTHNHPELHLKVDAKNQVILNAADLATDLRCASDKYFDAAISTPALSEKAHLRFTRDGFLGKSPLEMP